ncbi:MAG: precorrin-2 C(20)-methyltransferase [Firmicutes bacterium]|nr:precorrin-2 C(20)-methyltransferase [Bacillota bacterium]
MGILYGIGVGPGESTYLTEQATKALAASSVICVPKSKVERTSVAYSAAKAHLPATAIVEELLFPMTRDEKELQEHWEQAASRVAQLVAEYGTVSFLTIGDPLLYSTFGYLMKCLGSLAPSVQVEVIPGISSFTAAAALIKVPLVEKNERLAIVPVPISVDDFIGLSRYVDTVVFLKVSSAYEETLALLERTGFAHEAYLVSRVGSKDEFWTNDPFAYRDKAIDYLSLLIAKRRRN